MQVTLVAEDGKEGALRESRMAGRASKVSLRLGARVGVLMTTSSGVRRYCPPSYAVTLGVLDNRSEAGYIYYGVYARGGSWTQRCHDPGNRQGGRGVSSSRIIEPVPRGSRVYRLHTLTQGRRYGEGHQKAS